jgi:hypothetical protein
MFHFFHRTPDINLDCFTASNATYMTTPIVKASKAFPDWWLKLKPYTPTFHHTPENPHHLSREKEMTARDCYSIRELYKKGIILENWCDISFRLENGYFNYWYAANSDKPETHPREQLGEGFPNYHHIKLVSPWAFREKTGAKFLWLGAEWSLDKLEIKVLPGVINFDIISQVNVNMMFPIRNGTFMIPIGNPLVQLVPLSEKNLKVHNHLVTQEEFNKLSLSSNKPSFFGSRKTIQLRKRNKERGTCPFHGDSNG